METTRSRTRAIVLSISLLVLTTFTTFEATRSLFVQNEIVNGAPGNSLLGFGKSEIKLENKSVSYFNNVSGYLASPSSNVTASGKTLPAVVMIHEWWGLNDNIKGMADQLAGEGYIVLAADLFNGTVATTPEEAAKLAGSVRDNPSNTIANLQAAVRYLASLENVNSSRIASLGWCFGGGQSLQLALNTESEFPLAATAFYYGNLITDQRELKDKVASSWNIR